MATATIFVKIIDRTTELTFEDNSGNKGKEITTVVKQGDKVKWKTHTPGLVLKGIPMKNSSGDSIWSDKPASKNNGEWEGKISETAAIGTEGYNVKYTINGGAVQEQDPKIELKD